MDALTPARPALRHPWPRRIPRRRLWSHEHRPEPNRSLCFMSLAFRPFRPQTPGSSLQSLLHVTLQRC